MKFLNQRNLLIYIAIIFVFFSGSAQDARFNLQPNGGGEYVSQNSKQNNCISFEERKNINSIKKINREKLNLYQNDIKLESRSQVKLGWPLKASNQLSFNSYYGISNFVDLNPNTGSGSFNQYGNTNLDYNCGNRSYDINDGYNHSGIDIFTWPFEWYLYENDLVEVIAAQSGYIIFKEDGNFDQNCSCNGNSNSIIIQHSDGSEAWYIHMKKFSLTNRSVGDYVNQGDYLGIVGSSGCSTGPHLHFEVRDSNYDVVEPFSGLCNNTTSSSWWNDQLPYRDPKINALITHFDVPEIGCPSINEDPKIGTQFQAGDFLLTAAYYRDQLKYEATNYQIRRPNGTIWKNWSHSSDKNYNASYWYWTHTIPSDAECGEWIFEADFLGSFYQFPFQVGGSVSALITSSGSTEFCEGESVELIASGGTSYQWTGPNGFLSNNQTITATQNGIYQVEAFNADNCSDIETVTINLYSIPNAQITASGSTEICAGESVVLTASGGTSYQWTGPNGFLSYNQSITANESGTYEVEVSNVGDCKDIETQNITLFTIPEDIFCLEWLFNTGGDANAIHYNEQEEIIITEYLGSGGGLYYYFYDCSGTLINECRTDDTVFPEELCSNYYFDVVSDSEQVFTFVDEWPECDENPSSDDILCFPWFQDLVNEENDSYCDSGIFCTGGSGMLAHKVNIDGEELIQVSLSCSDVNWYFYDYAGNLIDECLFYSFSGGDCPQTYMDAVDNGEDIDWDCFEDLLPCDNTTPPWPISPCNSINTQSVFLDRANDRFNVEMDGQELTSSDWIGVFYTDEDGVEHCQAAIPYPASDATEALVICADDPLTPEKDGFVAYEEMIYRLWVDGQERTDIKAAYHPIGAFGNFPNALNTFESNYTRSYLSSIQRKVVIGSADCDDPVEIGCEKLFSLSNDTGNPSGINVFCSSDNYVNGPEVYFRYENDQVQDLKIGVTNLEQDLEVYILNEDCDEFNCIAYTENQENEDELLLLTQVPIGAYHIAIDGYIGATSTFDIEIECGDFGGGDDDDIDPDDPDDPSTSECPKSISCGSSVVCTTVGLDNNFFNYGCTPNRFNGGAEKIFTFNNSETKWVLVNMTPEQNVNLDLFILSGLNPQDHCVTSSTEYGDSPEGVWFKAIANKDYYIIVDGYDEDEGSFTMSMETCRTPNGGGNPADDIDCTDAEEIFCSQPIVGTNAGGDENISFWGSCNTKNNTGPEVFYKFNNPVPQQVLIELTGMTQNLNVFLLNGCEPSQCVGKGGTKGTQIGDTQDEAVIYPLLPPGEYIIVIDGVNGAVSDFTLNVDCEISAFDCLEIDLIVGDNGDRGNFISSCYLPADRSIETIFNQYKDKIVSINDENGNTWTIGDPNCPIENWEDLDAFNIILREDITDNTTIEICGSLANPESIKDIQGTDANGNPIKNYIGYPFEESKPAIDAFENVDNLNLMIWKTPNMTQTQVFGTTTSTLDLKPGNGYILIAYDDDQINYRNENYIDNGCTKYLMKWSGSPYLSHIRISENLAAELNILRGNEIAITNDEDQVIASHLYQGQSFTLTLEGDDRSTSIDEGFSLGESISIRVWNPNSQLESDYKLSQDGNPLEFAIGKHYQPDDLELISNIINDEINPFVVYPNPFNHTIRIHGDWDTDSHINIYDIQGKRASQHPHENGNIWEIDLNSLPKGVYILEIRTNGFIQTEKIVKQ